MASNVLQMERAASSSRNVKLDPGHKRYTASEIESLKRHARVAHADMRSFLEKKGVTIDPDIAALQAR